MSFILNYFFPSENSASKPVISHPHLNEQEKPAVVTFGPRAETDERSVEKSVGFQTNFISVRTRVLELESKNRVTLQHLNEKGQTPEEYASINRVKVIVKIYERLAKDLATKKNLTDEEQLLSNQSLDKAKEIVARLDVVYEKLNKDEALLKVFRKQVQGLIDKAAEEMTEADVALLENSLIKSKSKLEARIQRIENLVQSIPFARDLLKAGVIQRKEKQIGQFELGSDLNARVSIIEEETDVDIDNRPFINPIHDISEDVIAQDFQTQYTEEERIEMTDRLLSSNLEFNNEAQINPTHDAIKEPKRGKRSREERLERAALSNLFLKGLVEVGVLEKDLDSKPGYKVNSNAEVRGKVYPSDFVNEAFDELDAEEASK